LVLGVLGITFLIVFLPDVSLKGGPSIHESFQTEGENVTVGVDVGTKALEFLAKLGINEGKKLGGLVGSKLGTRVGT